MIHPPKQDEAQNPQHGDPSDSGCWKDALVSIRNELVLFPQIVERKTPVGAAITLSTALLEHSQPFDSILEPVERQIGP